MRRIKCTNVNNSYGYNDQIDLHCIRIVKLRGHIERPPSYDQGQFDIRKMDFILVCLEGSDCRHVLQRVFNSSGKRLLKVSSEYELHLPVNT